MGIHDGHRKHLRENFLKAGLAGKTDHQVLELLLTYAIPRIDVNPVAHDLINRFGSLSGVIDANVEDLVQIDHVSENCAVLLKLIPQIAAIYNESKWKERPVLKTPLQINAYMLPRLIHEKNEVFYLLTLDAHHQLIELIRLAEGTPNESQVYVRHVVNECLRVGAMHVALAHNHPSGHAAPSPADVQLTSVIRSALDPLGINLLDHIVVGGKQTFSFSSKGMLPHNG